MIKKDIETREDIAVFVTAFYDQLATDELLKNIFFARLGNGDWQPHLQVIVNFWDSVLFGSPTYKGSSFMPHNSMQLQQIHFDKWLQLLNQSIDDNFEGVKTTEAKTKANTMAILFMSKINYNKENGITPLI
jgi:hemoglobin